MFLYGMLMFFVLMLNAPDHGCGGYNYCSCSHHLHAHYIVRVVR